MQRKLRRFGAELDACVVLGFAHRLRSVALLVLFGLFSPLSGALAQEEASPEAIFEPMQVPVVRTDTPSETLKSFLALRSALETSITSYFQSSDRDHAVAIDLVADQMISLIDLSDVPTSSHRAVGMETLGYLLDIMGRIPLSGLEDAVGEGGKPDSVYRIKGTPLRIVPISNGPDSGQYQLSARTVSDAPKFFRSVSHRSLRSALDIESWHLFKRQMTGPWIPPGFVAALCEMLQKFLSWSFNSFSRSPAAPKNSAKTNMLLT